MKHNRLNEEPARRAQNPVVNGHDYENRRVDAKGMEPIRLRVRMLRQRKFASASQAPLD